MDKRRGSIEPPTERHLQPDPTVVIFSRYGEPKSEVVGLPKVEVALVALSGAAVERPVGEQHAVGLPPSEVTTWANGCAGR